MILSRLAALLIVTGTAAADDGTAARAGLFADRQPLFSGAGAAKADTRLASLFVARAEGGFFAARPARLDTPLRFDAPVKTRLRDLIARAEAGRMGYDAVQYGARIKPPKRPTAMTLQQIYDWIDDTPGQPHAIGRYQFIPPTLKRLARRLDLPATTRFSPAVQDRLADLLLRDAGFARVQRGEITHEAFMLNLAKIWAGLPTPSGRSYYDGVAGNKAVLSYDSYARQVRAILGG